MEEPMHLIIHKIMKKEKLINNSPKKEIFVQIYAKFRKIMGQENFSGNLNEHFLSTNQTKVDLTLIFFNLKYSK